MTSSERAEGGESITTMKTKTYLLTACYFLKNIFFTVIIKNSYVPLPPPTSKQAWIWQKLSQPFFLFGLYVRYHFSSLNFTELPLRNCWIEESWSHRRASCIVRLAAFNLACLFFASSSLLCSLSPFAFSVATVLPSILASAPTSTEERHRPSRRPGALFLP